MLRPILSYVSTFVWGLTGSDELPPGIPSAAGLPVFWLRASYSAPVRGGGVGPPPTCRPLSSFCWLSRREMLISVGLNCKK